MDRIGFAINRKKLLDTHYTISYRWVMETAGLHGILHSFVVKNHLGVMDLSKSSKVK